MSICNNRGLLSLLQDILFWRKIFQPHIEEQPVRSWSELFETAVPTFVNAKKQEEEISP